MDKELVEAIGVLSKRGYKIALDDVVDPTRLGSLLDIASIVKLDLIAMDKRRLKEYVEFLRKYDVKILAEKIETPDDFDLCKGLGFDFFQGYFLCRPRVMRGHRMPGSRLVVIQLLARLQSSDIEFREVEEIVRRDVSLSYKLLRLINSAFYGIPVKIKSIHEALVYLGIRQIRAWLSLVILSKIDDKPRWLMTIAMVRAKMCERLSLAVKEVNLETSFMVGLFSVLDALLDESLEEILPSLPLSDEITCALLRREGPLGALLNCVLAYERGDWEEVLKSDFEAGVLRDAYLDSIDWAGQVSSLLEGQGKMQVSVDSP